MLGKNSDSRVSETFCTVLIDLLPDMLEKSSLIFFGLFFFFIFFSKKVGNFRTLVFDPFVIPLIITRTSFPSRIGVMGGRLHPQISNRCICRGPEWKNPLVRTSGTHFHLPSVFFICALRLPKLVSHPDWSHGGRLLAWREIVQAGGAFPLRWRNGSL